MGKLFWGHDIVLCMERCENKYLLIDNVTWNQYVCEKE